MREALKKDQKGVRVAWIGDWGGALPTEPGVMETCRAAVERMKDFGAVVEDIKPFYNMNEFWETIWLPIRHYCASSLKPWYDKCRQNLMKPESRWEYDGSLTMSAQEVYRAFEKRTEFYHAMLKVYDDYDYIVSPTACCFPFDKNVHWPETINGTPMRTYHNWMEIVTPWTMGGNAVCTVPAGFGGANRLSIGLQPRRTVSSRRCSSPRPTKRSPVSSTNSRPNSSFFAKTFRNCSIRSALSKFSSSVQGGDFL